MGGGPRVAVAMSGGVDSSVAAAVLLEQGYDVVGMTLRLWDCEPDVSPRKACCSIDGLEHARAVADRLNISHYVVDGRAEFERAVLRRAWQEYDRGRTPNPCVICNEVLKFGLLARKAEELGGRYVATGHHARIGRNAEHTGSHVLRGRDPKKDQSYFLFALSTGQLDRALMPVGELTKSEVRDHARKAGFPNADKPESQDACLGLDEGGFAEALLKRFRGKPRPGSIVDGQGRVLGRHQGIHTVTIGQRKGLGVAAGHRVYVTAIDGAKGEVRLGTDDELLVLRLKATGVRWSCGFDGAEPIEAEVQIRYQHRPAEATVSALEGGAVHVRFAEPQRAIAPGQAVVFYQGDRLAGGGWIECALD